MWMVVSELVRDAWASGSRHAGEQERGGFEIRRKEWSKVKDRIRKYTSLYWESRTFHVDC